MERKNKNGAVASAVLGAPVDRGHFDWRWRERPALALLVARSKDDATPHPSEVKACREAICPQSASLNFLGTTRTPPASTPYSRTREVLLDWRPGRQCFASVGAVFARRNRWPPSGV